MANTGNTQQQINYGAAVNDGQGDPLRTAFIKTDDNFDNIWLAGPVGSNITIINNTVQANNTNGNLILSPNGIGVIQTNSRVVPRLNNTYDLGSTTLKYRAGYFGIGGLSVDGNVTITGNLTAGNISYTSNVFVGDLEGSVFADDSTVMVDAIDNVLYAGRAAISGNVSATYFIGNGSQLTGVTSYANANVVAYGESGWAGNIIPSGNAVYSLGNATNQWNDLYVSNATIFMNNVPISLGTGNVLTVNGEALLSNDSNTSISTTGNITADYFFGNGSQLTGLSTSSISNGTSNVAIPTANGNATITANAASTWTFGTDSTLTLPAGSSRITSYGQITIETDNNASGMYLNADSVNLLYANANVTLRANSTGTNKDWNFDTTGNLTLPGATAGETIATQSGYITVGNLLIGQGGALFNSNNDSWALYGNLSDPGATIFIPSNADAGNALPLYIESQQSNVEIRSGSSTWNFGNTSNLTLPLGGIVYETSIPGGALTGNTIALKPQGGTNAAQQLLIYPTALGADANHLHLTTGNLYNTELFLGNDNLYVKLANTGNIVINSNDDVGNTAQWTFNNFGTLSLPGGSQIRPLGANLDIIAGTGSYVNLITSDESSSMGVDNSGGYIVTAGGTWGFSTTGNLTAPGNVSAVGNITGAYILGNGSQLTGLPATYGNANVATFLAAYGSNTISTTGNITAGNLIGNISITGNVIGTQPNVTLVAGSYDWTFDNTGNLTLPGNTFAVNYADNTLVDVVTRFEGSWTVPTGNSTQSFTVTPNNTYNMWVEGNIPNGIIVWNATATITNTNVPVAGVQYAWVYNGGGTPIDFTSIPNQFEGTANTIVRSNVAPSTTTNRFDFGINNTSGNTQVVRYGWIKIS